MDDQTYDEDIGANHVIAERDFQNPLYSDIGPGSYEILHSESALVSETLYDDIHNCVPGALTNRGEQVNGGQGMRNRTASSEAIYDMPLALYNVDDDNCYSTLDPADYFTLQPHTSKATQQQLPPNDDEYSCLQHT